MQYLNGKIKKDKLAANAKESRRTRSVNAKQSLNDYRSGGDKFQPDDRFTRPKHDD
jgi:hypothetical protein